MISSRLGEGGEVCQALHRPAHAIACSRLEKQRSTFLLRAAVEVTSSALYIGPLSFSNLGGGAGGKEAARSATRSAAGLAAPPSFLSLSYYDYAGVPLSFLLPFLLRTAQPLYPSRGGEDGGKQQPRQDRARQSGLRVSICAARPRCPHLELPQIRRRGSRRRKRCRKGTEKGG